MILAANHGMALWVGLVVLGIVAVCLVAYAYALHRSSYGFLKAREDRRQQPEPESQDWRWPVREEDRG